MTCFPDSNSILNMAFQGFTLQHLLLDTLELQPRRGHIPCLCDGCDVLFGWELFVKEKEGRERGGGGRKGKKEEEGSGARWAEG